MKRQQTMGTGEFQYTTTVEQPYAVLTYRTTESEFTARLWGLAKWVPNDNDWHVVSWGAFRRDGRHVEYSSSVIYEDGELIHDPFGEMIDDIGLLIQ